MPLFDYICKTCNKDFEELVQRNQKDVTCPYCKSLNTKKLLIAKNGKDAFVPIFRGKGFYETDYKNKK